MQQSLRDDQDATRIMIGEELLRVFPAFRSFLYSVDNACSRGTRGVLGNIVGLLLEERFDVTRCFVEEEAQVMRCCLTVDRLEGTGSKASSNGHTVLVHRLTTSEQAEHMVHTFRKRKYDQKLHLGELVSGRLVALKVPTGEEGVTEAEYPILDVDRDFPSRDNVSIDP